MKSLKSLKKKNLKILIRTAGGKETQEELSPREKGNKTPQSIQKSMQGA